MSNLIVKKGKEGLLFMREKKKDLDLPYYFDVDLLINCYGKSIDIIVISENEKILSFFFYLKEKRFFFEVITQPKITQIFGLHHLYNHDLDERKNFEIQFKSTRLILDNLSKFDYFSINTNIQNNLPFQWHGFKEEVKYNYLLNLRPDLELLFNNLDGSVRNKIRKANNKINVFENKKLDDFYNLYEMTFHRQKISPPLNKNLFQKMDSYLAERKMRTILIGEDGQGIPHSGLYLIHDQYSGYLNMIGENPSLRNSGAGVKLIWESIKILKSMQIDLLNFQGSSIEKIEQLRRYFGARQEKYFNLRKIDNIYLKLGFYFKNIL